MKPNQQSSRTDCDEAAAPCGNPPVFYFPACGALCDAFWWARPRPSAGADGAGAARYLSEKR